jgi:hypothetical protein
MSQGLSDHREKTHVIKLSKNRCFNGGIVRENKLICIGYKEGPIIPVFLLIHC